MRGEPVPTSDFLFTLMTDDARLAALADGAGIDRIGIDLDRLGKAERQPTGYRISGHTPADLDRLRKVVRRARLFARTDPLHPGSRRQVEEVLARGVTSIMLPMFRRVDEVERFVDIVDGRAEVVLLVETAAAAFRIADIVRIDGIDEIMVGLNDLHLDVGLNDRFEIVVSEVMESLAWTVRSHGIRFGFGGLGRADDDSLPVPSSLVYPQYARLGATSAIVARSFHRGGHGDLGPAMGTARRTLDDLASAPRDVLERARERLRRHLELGRADVDAPREFARRAA